MSIIKNKETFEESLTLFKSFQPESLNMEILPPNKAEGKDFFSDFPGNLIQKPYYYKCRFYQSQFNSSNGAYTKLHCCSLFDCNLNNCDFRYSDFTKSTFENDKEQTIINSCNFSFSNFIGDIFRNVDFSGISFRQMLIEDSDFIDCTIENSSFEETSFNNCRFTNLDLRKVGIRFCEFVNCTFDNVIFPILDLASNIGLIPLFLSQKHENYISLGTQGTTNITEAIQMLHKLMPYYYKTHQYYQIVNILLVNNEQDRIWELLHEAFNYVIGVNDFPALLGICNLIVKLHIFDQNKLKLLYNRIVDSVKPEELPYHLLKSYLVYIKNIQNLLLDNPSQFPTAQLILSTDIDENARHYLIHIIDDIEATIQTVDTNISPMIQLTHHSPYEILVFMSAELPTLLQICQTFYYTFGGIKNLKDISGSRHEKTTNKQNKDTINNTESKKTLNISLSFGLMSVNFHKETIDHVKSSEYFIA